MNRIFKLNILYYLSFILISLSRIIIGKSITENTLYPLLILIGSYLIAFIYYKLIKKENYFNVINTTLPVLNLSCYYFTNNVIISLVLIAILSILYKFIKINYICIFYLLYLYICNKLNLDITLKDNVLFLIGSYVLLMTNEYYKREIALFTVNSYVLTALILYISNIGNINNLTNIFFRSGIVYIAVIIISNNEYSPLTFIGKVIYSFIIGISSCLIFSLTSYYYIEFIIILVINIILLIKNKDFTT